MTVHVRNATDDLICLPILATGNSITFAGMKKAMDVDSFISVQHFPAAGGLVTQANEITYAHCFSLYPLSFLAVLSSSSRQEN